MGEGRWEGGEGGNRDVCVLVCGVCVLGGGGCVCGVAGYVLGVIMKMT